MVSSSATGISKVKTDGKLRLHVQYLLVFARLPVAHKWCSTNIIHTFKNNCNYNMNSGFSLTTVTGLFDRLFFRSPNLQALFPK